MASISTALVQKSPFSAVKLHLRPQNPLPKCPSLAFASPKCPSRLPLSISAAAAAAPLIEPDGGRLVDLVIPEGPTRDSLRREAAAGGPLPRVKLSRIDVEWVHVLSEGWASPLGGFMRESEFLQTLHFNAIRLADGSAVNMSVPIVLAIDDDKKKEIGDRKRVALVDDKNKPIAILNE